MIYLTGCSTAQTRAADRPDLGMLATPDSGIYHQRHHYGSWAADNACFAAPPVTGTGYEQMVLGSPCPTASAREVRYGPTPNVVTRWLDWLTQLDPTGCLFAALPDVVGDHAATWERSAMFIERVHRMGFPAAIVLQDGVEHDAFVWGSIMNGVSAVFIGGSTEWKMGPAVARLVALAKEQDKWVHMGRVNSWKRISYAESIGCDSADGTFIGYGPSKNAPIVEGWLDRLHAQPRLEVAS